VFGQIVTDDPAQSATVGHICLCRFGQRCMSLGNGAFGEMNSASGTSRPQNRCKSSRSSPLAPRRATGSQGFAAGNLFHPIEHFDATRVAHRVGMPTTAMLPPTNPMTAMPAASAATTPLRLYSITRQCPFSLREFIRWRALGPKQMHRVAN